jgi:hypothetical protein
MATDLKPSSLDFGVVIAFLAPGFVAFHGASYHAPTARAWMAAAAEKEQSVGVFLFVLLASLSIGLVVSGVRALTIDKLLRLRHLPKRLVVPPLSLDWSKVDEKRLSVLLTIRDAHYRHYQFYSNTLVALLLWACARACAAGPGLLWQHWTLIAAAVVALLLSARESLLRYVTGVQQVMTPQ